SEAVADLEKLPALIRKLIETASEILVVSPVLVGRLRWLAVCGDVMARRIAYQRRASVGRKEARCATPASLRSTSSAPMAQPKLPDLSPKPVPKETGRRFYPRGI